MQVVDLVVRHDCPFSEPLARATGARVTHLCHRGDEAMLEVHASDPSEVVRLAKGYSHLGGETVYEEPDRSAMLLRFPACACCRSGRVIPTLEERGQLYLPPSSYSPEGERYQFLVQGERLEPRVAERLPPGVTLVRVGTRPLTSLEFEGSFLVPVGTFFRDLTDRQRQALLTAILRGYYRIPRAVASEELARAFGISRPAFDALLRKAESKLATALFPYLTVQGLGPSRTPPTEEP
ncbi:MAG TPA: helix-turn-helix domain-containing protein [Thermoplasmata archaeon]|nr:helix-turn-helix domain-containing protein [Thermoplasmata archaeon]